MNSKVIGRMHINVAPIGYKVKRRNTSDLFDATIIESYGVKGLAECQEICNELNNSDENKQTTRSKSAKSKKHFHFPTMAR